MGKITSMHFTGWKLGLKTGMYYLRTMAASAPIQFTVDQEKLKVVDTNVAKAVKKRGVSGGYNAVSATPAPAVAVPAPMFENKPPNDQVNAPNGVVTPAATPPPEPQPKKRTFGRTSSAVVNPEFPADQEEGDSPEVLAADGTAAVPKAEELPGPAVKQQPSQEEDKEDESKEREGDIYADAVLACSIENKEACVMCSG
jgi:ribonucleoside-diphosphate reductase subunit M1